MIGPGAERIAGYCCVRCGEQHAAPSSLGTCTDCGGNLWVEYEYDRIASAWSPRDLARNPDHSIWRYLPILPVQSGLQWPVVGWTPLVRASRLEERCALRQLFIKDDGRNPSASFKDRASAVALVRARELGHNLVTGASTGNAASATALVASAMGIRSRIFVPKSAPRAKIAQLLAFGAEVFAVDGTYDQAFELCLAATARYGWYNRNTGTNPTTREGKKTVAFELFEQLGSRVPDLVVVPVGDGNIISGVGKGFEELVRLGFSDRVPRLLAVQAQGSDAIVSALETDGIICPVSGVTVADSISVSIPRDGEAAVQVLRRSGGFGIRVSDQEILQAIPVLARGASVFAEPAAAAAWAGFEKALAQGLVDPAWTVVILITGNGLKDIASVMKSVSEEPILIGPDESELDRVFSKTS